MNTRIQLRSDYEYLVSTTIAFIQDYFEGIVPAGKLNEGIYWYTKATGEQLKALWTEEASALPMGRAAKRNIRKNTREIEEILAEYLSFALDYLKQGAPWDTIANNRSACRNTILNTLQMIVNLTLWMGKLKEQNALSVQSALELEEAVVCKLPSGYDLSQLLLADIFNISSNRRAVG